MIENKKYIEPITNIIDRLIGTSNSIPSVLNQWSTNKFEFYKRFGDKTIIRSEEMTSDIEDINEIRKSYLDFIEKASDFIEDPLMLELFKNFFSASISEKGFKNNEVIYNWHSDDIIRFLKRRGIFTSNDNVNSINKKINRGMKFSKALAAFFDTNNEESNIKLKDFQILYSTYRQKLSSKKKGRVYLSIDPFDFLSVSDNNHNWSSCHSIIDGEYRIGNLNYMADSVTMVGYYITEDNFNENLYAFDDYQQWNSKQWRVLVHMKIENGKVIVAYSRQYPFSSSKLLKSLDNLMSSVLIDMEESSLQEFNSDIFPNQSLILSADNTHQYTDYQLDRDCYIRLSDSLKTNKNFDPIIVGKPILCLECNQNIATRSESGLCDSCLGEYYCEDCGEYHNEANMIWIDDEERYVCQYCFNERFVTCEVCSEKISSDEVNFLEVYDIAICNNCLKEIQKTETVFILNINDYMNHERENIEDVEMQRFYDEKKNEIAELKLSFDKADIKCISALILNNSVNNNIQDLFAIFSKIRENRNRSYDVNNFDFIEETNILSSYSIIEEFDRYISPYNNLKQLIVVGILSKEILDRVKSDLANVLTGLKIPLEKINYSRVETF